jgi:hypothetical protein
VSKTVYTTDGEKCSCGAPLKTVHEGYSETTVGYGSPPGHEHDDNCIIGSATCSAGHRINFSVRRRCTNPDCDWRGKEECFCHVGKKLDKWPTVASQSGGGKPAATPATP